MIRAFDAPPAVVFEAWSKPEHIINWWGPNDFTVPLCEVDFRVGGRYRLCMRSPEGEDHWVWGDYHAIEPPVTLSFSWNREDSYGNIWNSTLIYLTFSEENGTTRFSLRQRVFANVEDRNAHNEGWTQCLERLNGYVRSIIVH